MQPRETHLSGSPAEGHAASQNHAECHRFCKATEKSSVRMISKMGALARKMSVFVRFPTIIEFFLAPTTRFEFSFCRNPRKYKEQKQWGGRFPTEIEFLFGPVPTHFEFFLGPRTTTKNKKRLG